MSALAQARVTAVFTIFGLLAIAYQDTLHLAAVLIWTVAWPPKRIAHEDGRMDDLLAFLVGRIMDDNHAYAYVAGTLGGEALLDSHLPMLDLIEQLVHDYKAMDPADSRSAGLAYALRVLAQSYAEHPTYEQEWRP